VVVPTCEIVLGLLADEVVARKGALRASGAGGGADRVRFERHQEVAAEAELNGAVIEDESTIGGNGMQPGTRKATTNLNQPDPVKHGQVVEELLPGLLVHLFRRAPLQMPHLLQI
jgi:hypothetical protein